MLIARQNSIEAFSEVLRGARAPLVNPICRDIWYGADHYDCLETAFYAIFLLSVNHAMVY